MKKRAGKLLLALCVLAVQLAALPNVSSFAAEPLTFDVSVRGEPVIEQGSTVTVDVAVANNPGITGATFTMEYPEYLTFDSFAQNQEVKGPVSVGENHTTFTWAQTEPFSPTDAGFLTVKFTVNENAVSDGSVGIAFVNGRGTDDPPVDVNGNPMQEGTYVVDNSGGVINPDGGGAGIPTESDDGYITVTGPGYAFETVAEGGEQLLTGIETTRASAERVTVETLMGSLAAKESVTQRIEIWQGEKDITGEATAVIGTGTVIQAVGGDGTELESVTVVVKGDVTGNGALGDGACNIQDAQLVFQHAGRFTRLEGAQLAASQVDGVGSVGIADAYKVFQFAGRFISDWD